MISSARPVPSARARRLPKAGMVGPVPVRTHLPSSVRSSPLHSMSVAGMENGDDGFAAVQKSFARGSKNG